MLDETVTLTTSLQDTFFAQFFSVASGQKNSNIAFKDHTQFPLIIDILSRKFQHHALLQMPCSAKLYPLYWQAFLQHLTQTELSPLLRGVTAAYFDLDQVCISKTRHKSVEKQFQFLQETLDSQDKCLLLGMPLDYLANKKYLKTDIAFLLPLFRALLNHPKCRFLLFAKSTASVKKAWSDHIAPLLIEPLNEQDIFAILKQERVQLENFHNVIIPDDLLTHAYALAERYLSTHDMLEKALLLLDSSAARIAAAEKPEGPASFKSVLTTNGMLAVLSGWTQIPISHLHLNRFRLADFRHAMEQRVFGQEAAIILIGHELQQAQAQLQQHAGPFCSLLFAGPAHSGKHTAALAIAEQLFKQQKNLFLAQPASSHALNIVDLKLQRYEDKKSFVLKELIRQTPHAIIFIDTHQLAPSIVEGLQEILSTGCLNFRGESYHFNQAIIILSTTAGADRLVKLAEAQAVENEPQNLDLMQLIMNEQTPSTDSVYHFSAQELVDEIMPDVLTQLSPAFCQHLHIIPFLPLDKAAIENIIRARLKTLGKRLEAQYAVELGYAPEVLRYLAAEVVKQEGVKKTINTDQVLKQLYFVIEQAILNQSENKHRPNQLFLQLNETGQLLRCDWLMLTPTRQHAT